jgi:hypothetical protein
MKVQNMTSNSGLAVPNQFIIRDDKAVYFQSYNYVIAKQENGKTYLDSYYWDYSTTTGKYRNMFLGETIKETREKIKNGTYILIDLNNKE